MGKTCVERHYYPAEAYPSRHPKGSFWATDMGWDILDRLPVGTLDNTQRAYICGLIAGALIRERERRASSKTRP